MPIAPNPDALPPAQARRRLARARAAELAAGLVPAAALGLLLGHARPELPFLAMVAVALVALGALHLAGRRSG